MSVDVGALRLVLLTLFVSYNREHWSVELTECMLINSDQQWSLPVERTLMKINLIVFKVTIVNCGSQGQTRLAVLVTSCLHVGSFVAHHRVPLFPKVDVFLENVRKEGR